VLENIRRNCTKFYKEVWTKVWTIVLEKNQHFSQQFSNTSLLTLFWRVRQLKLLRHLYRERRADYYEVQASILASIVVLVLEYLYLEDSKY
jgi:hypothetical protein